jgi:hypothetical protein
MKPTPEQTTADEALQEAVARCARAYERFPPDATLISYTLVFEAMRFDPDEDSEYEYHGVINMGGGERRSVALGNLQLGIQKLTAAFNCHCDDNGDTNAS